MKHSNHWTTIEPIVLNNKRLRNACFILTTHTGIKAHTHKTHTGRTLVICNDTKFNHKP